MVISGTHSRSATGAMAAHRLDSESRGWVEALGADGRRHDAAVDRLHRLLLSEARHEVRRRTASMAHPSGRDLDDLGLQAADDALVAILGKLDQFRGDALFTTWARRFVQLEVPGKIRRRLGHARETPIDEQLWQTYADGGEEPQAISARCWWPSRSTKSTRRISPPVWAQRPARFTRRSTTLVASSGTSSPTRECATWHAYPEPLDVLEEDRRSHGRFMSPAFAGPGASPTVALVSHLMRRSQGSERSQASAL